MRSRHPAGTKVLWELRAGAPPPPTPTVQGIGSPESYIPKHLAEKILTSKSALEGKEWRGGYRVRLGTLP
jgi:hypothetical protein